jgi:pSer/pThr/pTyr-binding forkhead associated (FHA) protein/tetratricopeptide (TPR) repeat protein
MPAVLIVSRSQTQIRKSPLSDAAFVIGRSAECDLPLEDKAVSRQHAKILFRQGNYEIQDLGSRNGTLLNKDRIKAPVLLREGDVVTIGPFDLRFYQSERASTPSAAPADAPASATMAIDAKDVARVGKQARTGSARGRGSDAFLSVKVVVTDGPLKGTTFDRWGEVLTFGRSSENNVILQDEAVSLKHARIVRDGATFVIEDLGSSNGTFVQGGRIQRHELRNGQKIRIGTSNFEFVQTDPVRQRTIRMVALVSFVFIVLLAVVAKLAKPEDKGEQLAALGWGHYNQGNYEEAIKAFEHALVVSPQNASARQGIESTRRDAETARQLTQARALAEKERYDEALTVCYEILRLRPDHQDVKQLVNVIQSVGEARVALEARNWKDAIHLLTVAQRTYSGSSVIQGLLQRAESELQCQEYMTKAKEFLSFGQTDSARPLLQKITDRSVFFPEAKALLESAQTAQTISKAQQDAQQAFLEGDIGRALELVDGGLQADPNNEALKKMKSGFAALAPLVAELARTATLLTSSDAAQIQAMQETCKKIIAADSDPRNKLRLQAEESYRQLQARRVAISQTATSEGDRLLAAGELRAALDSFLLAERADTGNLKAKQSAQNIQTRIVEECRKHFQQGLVHEELDQSDLALQSYEKVLKVAAPGESYYERAKEKIAALQRRR